MMASPVARLDLAGAASQPMRTHMTAGMLVLSAIAFAAVLIARHPSMVWHAEFWAEDGWVWYPIAYNWGLQSLLQPVAGYLQTISRLVALISQLFPISWAPTIFMASALLIQIAPVVFLVSWRMDDAWRSRPARFAFAFLYLTLPNVYEVFVNLTNSQWHLCVLAFFILASRPPAGWAGRCFDTLALAVTGLSGPFVILLAPMALWNLYDQRSVPSGRRTALWRLAIIVVTGCVQGMVIIATFSERSHLPPNGSSIGLLAKILARQIVLGPIMGLRQPDRLMATGMWTSSALPILLVVVALTLCAIAFWRGPYLLRKACVFASMLLFACLWHPVVTLDQPQWNPLVWSGLGGRYWYIPLLLWTAVLLRLIADRAWPLRAIGCVILATSSVGIWNDWFYPFMPPTTFQASAKAFEAAPPGSRISFPVNPPGVTPMVLTKKP